jgi:AcrR family transcriptional regulator
LEDQSTKALLLHAAIELLSIGGPNAVTLRAVGARVGVSHNAPYRHFEDKRALLAAVARHGFAQLHKLIASAIERAGSPLEAVLAIAPVYISFARDNPRLYNLLFGDPGLVEESTGGIEAKAKSLFSLVEAAVRAALPAERQHAAGVLTTAIYSASHGVLSLELSGRLRSHEAYSSADEMIEMLIRQLLE